MTMLYKLTVVFEYYVAIETYSRIWVLRRDTNLQSYLNTVTQIRSNSQDIECDVSFRDACQKPVKSTWWAWDEKEHRRTTLETSEEDETTLETSEEDKTTLETSEEDKNYTRNEWRRQNYTRNEWRTQTSTMMSGAGKIIQKIASIIETIGGTNQTGLTAKIAAEVNNIDQGGKAMVGWLAAELESSKQELYNRKLTVVFGIAAWYWNLH